MASANGWLSEISKLIKKSTKDFKYLDFEVVKSIVKKMKFKSSEDWFAYCKTGKKNDKIPTAVSRIYKDKGWINWPDFLGKNE
jgi:hypothetical protein